MAIKKGTNLKDKLIGTNAADQLFGLAGDDLLFGKGGKDILYGGAGNDTLDGGKGNDKLFGGKGNDTYIVDSAGDTVVEKAGQGIDHVKSSVTHTLAANVENLTLTGSSANSGTGNALDNIITGNAGDNILNGGLGADTLIGGAGNDIYILDNAGDTVTDTSGTDTVQASISYVLGAGIENLTLTGANAISGTGNALDNIITGNAGDNILDGGLGADTLIGGAGSDTVSYAHNIGGAFMALDNSVLSQGDAAGDTYSGIENVIGSNGDDSLEGNTLSNIIFGLNGDDFLAGKSGADTLFGGSGGDILAPGDDLVADVVDGGDGIDTVSYFDSSIGVTVNFETAQMLGGAVNDVLTSIENIMGSGNADILTVRSGGTAWGGAGGDRISGSTTPLNITTETLIGGAGNDAFELHLNTGMDKIIDFTTGDHLLVSAAEFFGVTYNPTGLFPAVINHVVNNVTNGVIQASVANPQFIFDEGSATLYFDSDGTGSNSPIAVALLSNHLNQPLTNGSSLVSSDFLIV